MLASGELWAASLRANQAQCQPPELLDTLSPQTLVRGKSISHDHTWGWEIFLSNTGNNIWGLQKFLITGAGCRAPWVSRTYTECGPRQGRHWLCNLMIHWPCCQAEYFSLFTLVLVLPTLSTPAPLSLVRPVHELGTTGGAWIQNLYQALMVHVTMHFYQT